MTGDASQPPVLLVLRAFGGLSEFLTGVPAYHALAEAFPNHKRILAAPASLRSIVRLCGCFDELLPVQTLARLPRIHRPDIAVNLHGCSPESQRVLTAARPRRLIAFQRDDAPASRPGPRWRRREHEVERWCRLLEESGIRSSPFRLELPRPRAIPPGARRATLIHPCAASEPQRWPLDRWAAVARSERASGRRVILTGSMGEHAMAWTIARAAGIPPSDVYAGRTSLRALAGLVAAAARVVTSDIGVGHLATAMGTPSVTLFGSPSPFEWGPPAHRPWHRIVWHGCAGAHHATAPDPALLAIEVDEVLQAIAQLAFDAPDQSDMRCSA